jgi:carboxypeptidase C (cathepsin A)
MTRLTKRDLFAGAVALAATRAFGQAGGSMWGGSAFVTRHSGTFGGRPVDYVATVGPTILAGKDGQPVARLVCTSYVATNADAAKRPVLFIFNGGPSAPSATLHMLALGPQRIAVEQDPAKPAPAPSMSDNPLTVLDVADLVFVDPVETGFSRILPAGRRDYFYSVNGDAQSISDFVVAWVKANGRDASPKYVLGESYGTMRAAVMAGQLANVMPLDGVFLFGQAVNMIETSQRAQNALAYATNITCLAAIAAYHGKAPMWRGKSPAQIVDAAYAWGMTEYLQALVRGNDLPVRERRRIAQKLEAMTGIGAGWYLEHDLAITKLDFMMELLRDRGQMMAMYDARYVGRLPAKGERMVDPMGGITSAVPVMMKKHLTENLGVTWSTDDYRGSAPGTDAWTWDGTLSPGGPFLDYDYQARITEAFAANPRFRLMIGTGYYDLTTTIGPARYLVTRSRWPRERVLQRQYVGGHIAYTHAPSHVAFTNDIRAWVTGGQPA